jgi:hypothetical protein
MSEFRTYFSKDVLSRIFESKTVELSQIQDIKKLFENRFNLLQHNQFQIMEELLLTNDELAKILPEIATLIQNNPGDTAIDIVKKVITDTTSTATTTAIGWIVNAALGQPMPALTFGGRAKNNTIHMKKTKKNKKCKNVKRNKSMKKWKK